MAHLAANIHRPNADKTGRQSKPTPIPGSLIQAPSLPQHEATNLLTSEFVDVIVDNRTYTLHLDLRLGLGEILI